MPGKRETVYELRYRTDSVQKGTKAVDTALKKTDKAFVASGAKVKDLTNQHKKLSDAQKKAGQAFTTTGRDVTKATGQFNTLGQTMGKVKGIVAGLGITFGGLMIARTIKDWTEAAIEFEGSINKVRTSLHFLGSASEISRKELDALFKRAATETGISGGINTAADAFNEMITTEWSVQKATEDLIPVLMFAATTGVDYKAAIDLAAKAQTNFNTQGLKTVEILSMANEAAIKGHLEFNEMGNAFERAGADAKLNNATYAEFLALNQELSRTKAGRQLIGEQRQLYRYLAGEINSTTGALHGYGLENETLLPRLEKIGELAKEDADIYEKVFGKTYAEVMRQVIEGLGDIEDAQLDATESLNNYNEAMEEFKDSTEYNLSVAKNAWESFKTDVGSVIGWIIKKQGEAAGGIMAMGQYNAWLQAGKIGEDVTPQMFQDYLRALSEGGGVIEISLPKEGEGGETEEEEGDGGGGTEARKKAEKELNDEKILLAIEAVNREYRAREDRERWLLDTTEQGRIEGLLAEFELRKDLQKEEQEALMQAAYLFSDAVVNAIRGRDVWDAFEDLFWNRVQGLIVNVFGKALSMIPGAGGFFGKLFNWLPFREGAVIDYAATGKIYKPRPGGWPVIMGEANKPEAAVPKSIHGFNLMKDYLIPRWFPALMNPAIYAQQGFVTDTAGQMAIPAPNVNILVEGFDPHGIRARQQVERGSRAKARTQG